MTTMPATLAMLLLSALLPIGASFVLRSPAVAEGGTLPVEFTGEGVAATLPLEWSGAPDGTASYAVIMHDVDPQGVIKCYWIVYGIPASVHTLPKDVKGIGTLGNNSINGRQEYAPPHSKRPGPENYVYTVYALSAPPQVMVPPERVNREVLLAAMKDRILATAELHVTYTRLGEGAEPPLPRSALPLKVVGVAVDKTDPSRSGAVVSCRYPEGQGHPSIVAPGARACGLAEVREVLADGVVVRNLSTNRLERLSLDAEDTASKAPPAAAAAPAERRPPPPVVAASPTQVTVNLEKDTIEHYLSNLPEVLSSALASPRYRDEGAGQRSIDGFEISGVQPGGVVDQLGLHNGDVIVEFNGDKLDSLSSVMRLMGQAQNVKQARMIVLRDGQRLTFVINSK